MHWKTIRVLTKKLEELIGQYERGEHLDQKEGARCLKDEWWVGIRAVSAALVGQFNMRNPTVTRTNPVAAVFLARSLPIEKIEFMIEVMALAAFSRKLLTDMDSTDAQRVTTTS
jgi:hypothetical protein